MKPVMTTFIHGDPKPKGRPRVTKHGTYTPPKTREWQNVVHAGVKAALPVEPPMFPIERVAVWMLFYSTPPSGLSKQRRADALAGKRIPRTSDVDNLAKAVNDALNGVLFADDTQVVWLLSEKAHATVPGVRIHVFNFDDCTYGMEDE